MEEYQRMEDFRNAKRLANALLNGTDSTDLRRIAQILNYNAEQLSADIESLNKVLQDLKEEDE